MTNTNPRKLTKRLIGVTHQLRALGRTFFRSAGIPHTPDNIFSTHLIVPWVSTDIERHELNRWFQLAWDIQQEANSTANRPKDHPDQPA